ncbi:NIPSNAP family containing protein [Spongiactinospora rosea]|uniref:NIPSNAP family containing protein n=1 Tax=Spongiactinospora rosea TaxID=2248750 RepID=A0A366M4P8_9ACTN|nr:NIPSNAP family protein [Spongiactinospora rosea]RBQ21228.1 NIPSNAP family containing protein [Spongiactinospora rosea]
MTRTTQLRVYTVRAGLLDEWADKWRRLVVPLRQQFGFEIQGAWMDRDRNQFFWILSYAGAENFAEINQRYWVSPERERIGLDHREYVVKTEVREVDEV